MAVAGPSREKYAVTVEAWASAAATARTVAQREAAVASVVPEEWAAEAIESLQDGQLNHHKKQSALAQSFNTEGLTWDGRKRMGVPNLQQTGRHVH